MPADSHPSVTRPGATRCTHCQVVTPYVEMIPRKTKSGRVKWYCGDCWVRIKQLGIKV